MAILFSYQSKMQVSRSETQNHINGPLFFQQIWPSFGINAWHQIIDVDNFESHIRKWNIEAPIDTHRRGH